MWSHPDGRTSGRAKPRLPRKAAESDQLLLRVLPRSHGSEHTRKLAGLAKLLVTSDLAKNGFGCILGLFHSVKWAVESEVSTQQELIDQPLSLAIREMRHGKKEEVCVEGRCRLVGGRLAGCWD